MTEGWGTWEEDRRYVNADGTHLIVVSKRTQNYGGEEKTFWKTERRKLPKLSRTERLYCEATRSSVG